MYRLSLTILFIASAFGAGPITLPSDFTRCSKSSPDLDKCLKPAIESGLKILVPGSRALDVLPIDPLRINTLDIHQGEGPVAVELFFKDVSITGISGVDVTDVKTDLANDVKTITVKLHADNTLGIQGKYTVNGKVLILPIQGDGNAKLDLTNVDAGIVLTGKLVKNNGIEYLIFNKVEFSLEPKNLKLNFENLFNGDKALGDNMNKFLNENWPEVYGELKNSIQNAFASTVIAITNNIFAKVPYNDIFLE